MADFFGPASARNSVSGAKPTDGRGFGSLDSWFKDCTSPTVEDGTVVSADFFNGLLAALRSLVRANGKLLDDETNVILEVGSNDSILKDAILQIIQRNLSNYAVDSGSANTIVAALTPALKEYKEGVPFRVKIAAANTGATTINVNGLGVKNVKRVNGAALSANDIVANGIAIFVYDGTNVQLLAKHTDSIGEDADRYIPPLTDATGTAAVITATYDVPTATPVKGDFFGVKLTATIVAGGTTFNPDGHGAGQMVDSAGVALAAGFAVNGEQLLLQFDSAGKYRVMNKPPQSSGALFPIFPAVGSYYTDWSSTSFAAGSTYAGTLIGGGLPGSWKCISVWLDTQRGINQYGAPENVITYVAGYSAFFQRVS